MKITGQIVDIPGKRIYGGEIRIESGIITSIKETGENSGPLIMPGFIDSHVHIESSMLVPEEFARISARNGVTGVITDPHEIANVLGIDGIDFMLESARKANFNFAFGAPSCVPSCNPDIDTNGATIDSKSVEKLLCRDDIHFLSEVMNVPGVLAKDVDVLAKIEAARKYDKVIDGHITGFPKKDIIQYAAQGISTNHECTSYEEGKVCIEAGMYLLIREGSAAKNMDSLLPLLGEYPEKIMFCTDDSHIDDLMTGGILYIVKHALEKGYNLWDVLRAACITPVLHYGLPWGILREGDKADFIMVNRLDAKMEVISVYINGKLLTTEPDPKKYEGPCPNMFKAGPISERDITISNHQHIIVAENNSITTGHDIVDENDPYPWEQVQKIVVYNRYHKDAHPSAALIRGFGIKEGAIAISVTHDSHNIICIGSDDYYIVKAVNEIVRMKGGAVALYRDEIAEISLPIAGIISDLDGDSLAAQEKKLAMIARKTGCTMDSPFISMSFMGLAVIPSLKITDKGLFDVMQWQFIGMND